MPTDQSILRIEKRQTYGIVCCTQDRRVGLGLTRLQHAYCVQGQRQPHESISTTQERLRASAPEMNSSAELRSRRPWRPGACTVSTLPEGWMPLPSINCLHTWWQRHHTSWSPQNVGHASPNNTLRDTLACRYVEAMMPLRHRDFPLMEGHHFYFRRSVSNGKSGAPLLRRPGAFLRPSPASSLPIVILWAVVQLKTAVRFLTCTSMPCAWDHSPCSHSAS